MSTRNVLLCMITLPLIVGSASVDGRTPTLKTSKVPFVGCRSDGQVGPNPAPRPGWTPSLPSNIADRLAYYVSSESKGVLAPRGWHCFGVYGSSGSGLIVSPEPLNSKNLLSEKGFRTTGYGVEWNYNFGGTSGRWAVAHAIARYFPRYRRFITDDFQNVDVGPLPTGPYASDILHQRTQNSVRYTTPARVQGEGTDWTLAPSMLPVDGIALLADKNDGPDLLRVNVRLRPEDRGLAEVILRQTEQVGGGSVGGEN